MLTAATLSVPATNAYAADGDARTAAGCVSNAEYSKLAVGQRMRYIRRVAGSDAQMSWRAWSRGAQRYQERLYDMCTPTDSAHGTLTTRFMYYKGAWRAYIVDTLVGPEPN
ncbi:MAG: hypothetical protein ACRDO0_03165 [Nocardioidaceae bacterium]